MCNNNACSMKLECYRFMAEANPYRQAYFSDDPRNSDRTCDYYWAVGNPVNVPTPLDPQKLELVNGNRN